MTFDEYQKAALATAVPKAKNLTYAVLGLVNEAGEVAGKLKKVMRGDRKLADAREDIVDELGDALWYLADAAAAVGYRLSDIADRNIKKLHDRQLRGKIQGDGDKR